MIALLRYALAPSLLIATASLLSAAPVVNDRAAPVQVLSGPEVPMQQILSDLMNGTPPNAQSSQSNIASFRPTESTIFTFLAGYAGYRSTNVFGIYEVANRAERDVFDGYVPNGTERSGSFSPSARATDFGWFLDVSAGGGYRLYSDDDRNPGGLPQSVVYIGGGQSFRNPSLGADGQFNTYDIIVAFEDLNRSIPGSSDDDFNDLIVLVENVNWQVVDPDFTVSLPEPASIMVWGFVAVGGLLSWSRRRKSKPALATSAAEEVT